jgi:hypothetical protein
MSSEEEAVTIPPIQVGESLASLAFMGNEDRKAIATAAAPEAASLPEDNQPAVSIPTGSQDQSLGQVYASRTGIVPRMFATSELSRNEGRPQGNPSSALEGESQEDGTPPEADSPSHSLLAPYGVVDTRKRNNELPFAHPSFPAERP